MCTIVITRCPSSVRPSSVHPSLTFHIFDFSSETTEQNSTKLDRKQDLNILYQVCGFFLPIGKTRWPPWSLIGWDIFNFSYETRWTEFNKNLTESKISMSSTKCVFFGPIRKIRWPPWPLIGWDIFDFSSVTTKRNSTKLDRKQHLNVLYQVFVFRAEAEKQDGRPGLWSKLGRKQDFNVLYQVCAFCADRKNKMATLASDLLRYFRLLLWNRWMEFNKSWQEARCKRPLPSLCILGRSGKKQDGRLGIWLAETFLTSPLNPLNGIQWNLTGSKISTSSTKFCAYCADRKNKMAALASDWLRHFRLLLSNRWTEFKETWQEARSQHPLPILCCFFSGRSEKQDGCPVLWLAETFST